MQAFKHPQPALKLIESNANELTDTSFDQILGELIVAKFNKRADVQLDRRPKADKGV